MQTSSDIIVASSDAAKELTHLGMEGFVFFSILVVGFIIGGMGYALFKMVGKIMTNHHENEKRIDEAHERIYTLENREAKCIDRVEKVTAELEACVRKMEGKL